MDVTGAEEARQRIEAELGREVPGISAVTGRGIPQLLHRIAESLAELRKPGGEPTAATPPERAVAETAAPVDTPPPVAVPGPATGV